jgi:hypothetical protein
MMAALQNVLNTTFTLNSINFSTKTKGDLSISYAEGAHNPVEAATTAGAVMEDWQKDVNTKAVELCASLIAENADISSHDLLKNVFSTYDGPRSTLTEVTNVRILKCKRKKTGLEVSFAIQDTSAPAAAKPAAPEAATTAKVSAKSTKAPAAAAAAPAAASRANRVNHVAAEAETVVDIVLRSLFSANADVAAIQELVRNQSEVEFRTALLPAAGKGKPLAAAKAAVANAQAAVDAAKPETVAALESVKLQAKLLVQRELTTFKNESYSEGLRSTVNRDALARNDRR